jgi:hypothetical protein
LGRQLPRDAGRSRTVSVALAFVTSN